MIREHSATEGDGDGAAADHLPVNQALLGLGAAGSAGAALVHGAAAGSHAGHGSLQVLFAVCAALQLGWAALAVLTPRRLVVVAGVVLNVGAVVVWVASRTVGVPPIDALRDAEPVGVQDSLAALLGMLGALGASASLVPGPARRTLATGWLAAGAAASLLLAVPAMAADHDGAAGDGHGHGDAAAATSTHAHGGEGDDEAAIGAGDDADAGGHGDHAIPGRLDHDPTDDQLVAARELIAETEAATTQYGEVAAAEAAGFRSIGDGRAGYEHFVNADHAADDLSLDPEHPESLVYEVQPDGGRKLTTVMYILPPGSTIDDVPDIAGNLTVWHDHDNLCFDDGGRIAGVLAGGRCQPGGELRPTPPMLHVWVEPNDCGPFAGTDARQMTGSCDPDSGI